MTTATTSATAGQLVNATEKVRGSNNLTTDFLASAQCLNFLLISDGSAVLRYST